MSTLICSNEPTTCSESPESVLTLRWNLAPLGEGLPDALRLQRLSDAGNDVHCMGSGDPGLQPCVNTGDPGRQAGRANRWGRCRRKLLSKDVERRSGRRRSWR